ncbi:hypothetical protein GGF37_005660 [Kickxella alabastrina]|nr:hypothetical protein GGF37_005660 [Kickxella alabastrina]
MPNTPDDARQLKQLLHPLLMQDNGLEQHTSLESPDDFMSLLSKLREHSMAYSDWTSKVSPFTSKVQGNERSMYPCITALLCFIARAIQWLDQHKTPSGNQSLLRRLVLPSCTADTVLEDAQDAERIDIGVELKPRDAPVCDTVFKWKNVAKLTRASAGKVWYSSLFGIIEAKTGSSAADKLGAASQVLRYIRNVHANQHDRRFPWGWTICGSVISAYVFGPHYVLQSHEFDIRTKPGLREFVHVIANYSYTEDYRLGYDPTLKYLADIRCYQIKRR